MQKVEIKRSKNIKQDNLMKIQSSVVFEIVIRVEGRGDFTPSHPAPNQIIRWKQVLINVTIVTRNGKIVLKHDPNRLFYALLRIKLYQNPFFSTVHQNTNKRKGRAVKTVCEIPFYLPMWLASGFILSSIKIQRCHDQFLPKKVASCQRNKLVLYQSQNGGSN